MEINFETMSLNELIQIKSILEERLSRKEKWVNSQRGYSDEEYWKRKLIFHNDEDRSKLKKVNQRIQDFINAV